MPYDEDRWRREAISADDACLLLDLTARAINVLKHVAEFGGSGIGRIEIGPFSGRKFPIDVFIGLQRNEMKYWENCGEKTIAAIQHEGMEVLRVSAAMKRYSHLSLSEFGLTG